MANNHIDVKIGPNGLKMYSVTAVLSPYFREAMEKSGVSMSTLEHASSKGTLVHSFCYRYALGIFGQKLPEDYAGYGQSFIKWADRYLKRVIWMERELVDPEFGYFGHPDIFCELIDQTFLSLIDLKTPIQYSTLWKLQLSAYRRLILVNKAWGIREEMEWPLSGAKTFDGWVPEIRCGSLQLDQDGGMPKYKPHDYSEADVGIFFGLLQGRRYIDS
jgi:hypothetical protein